MFGFFSKSSGLKDLPLETYSVEFSLDKLVPGVDFKRLCSDVLQEAINKAKSDSEIQIDLIAQIAIVKMLTEEIQLQFKTLIDYLNNYARKLSNIAQKYEISKNLSLSKYVQIKEKLSNIQQHKNLILLNVGKELFGYLIDVKT